MNTKWAECIKCGDSWVVSELTHEASYRCPACRMLDNEAERPTEMNRSESSA